MRIVNTALALLLVLGSAACGAGSSSPDNKDLIPPIPNKWTGLESLSPSPNRLTDYPGPELMDFSKAPLFKATGTFETSVTEAVPDDNSALLAFYYVSPIMPMIPLEDGELRRQVGVRLRGENDCNAVYIMWFVGTSSDDTEVSTRPEGIYIQEKLNPGMTTQAECHDHGFTTHGPVLSGVAKDISGLPGTSKWVLPMVTPGSVHWLVGAILPSGQAVAMADGHLVASVKLSDEALALHGLGGLRQDNVNMLVGMALMK